MVDINDLHVGDKVKIVDQWESGCRQNGDGLMDHWLGSVMTVREINCCNIRMEEDIDEWRGTGWYWAPAALDYIIDAPDVDIEDLI